MANTTGVGSTQGSVAPTTYTRNVLYPAVVAAGGVNATVTPATVVAVAAAPAPTILAAARPTPSVAVAVAATPAPTILASAIVAPATVAAVAGLQTPSVLVGGSATVPAATVVATASLPAPTILAAAKPTPAAVVAVAVAPAPTLQATAVAAPVTVRAYASVSVNLISNPSLEKPIAADGGGWWEWYGNWTGGTNPGPGSARAVDGTAPDGSYVGVASQSAAVAGQNVAVQYAHRDDGGIIPVTPGVTYRFSVWVKASRANQVIVLQLAAWNAGGGDVFWAPGSSLGVTYQPADGWVQVVFYSTAPATATHALVGVQGATQAATGDLFRFDDAQFGPVPAISGNAVVAPSTVVAVAQVPTSTLRGTAVVAPATVAAIASVPTPAIAVGGAASVTASTVVAIAALPAPTVLAAGTVAPSTAVAVAQVPAPTLRSHQTVAASVAGAVAAVPAPTVRGTAVVQPATVAAVASIQTPAFASAGDATVPAATVVATAGVPAPVVLAAARPTPNAVGAITTAPAPTVGVGVTPPSVIAVAAVPAPVLRGTAVATPATVTAFAIPQAPGVLAGGSVTVGASTVQAVAALGAPVTKASGQVVPSTVVSTAGLGTPVLRGTAVVGGITVTAIVVVPAPIVFGGVIGQPVKGPTRKLVLLAPPDLDVLVAPNGVQAATLAGYSAVVLADSPTGYWRMEDTSGSLTPAAGAVGLAAFGSLTYGVAGRSGSAVTFAGGRFEAPSAATFALTTGTIEAWIKTTTSSGGAGNYRGIVVKQFAFGMFAQAGVLIAFNWAAGGSATSSTSVANGIWRHVAFTFVNGGPGLLYADGVQVGSTGSFNISTQGTPLVIGEGTNGVSQPWDGQIDEVAVYSTPLSAARILAHYNAGSNPPTSAGAEVEPLVGIPRAVLIGAGSNSSEAI